MKPVRSDFDFASLEPRVLEFWRTTNAFEKLRELRREAPLFRFVDGPITANNPMGIHHAWGRTLKDAFLRYKAMTGHRCHYQNGFDCQGLWVEVEVERTLGFNGKPDIERFGIDNFSRACRERVNEYAGVISDQSARLGQWMDWSDSYYTMSDANQEGIWHFLQLCAKKGWIRRGALPMPWCPRCGTSLSEHEMAGSYQDVEHLSVFVRVPLLSDPSRRLLIWTTTPWTLAANVAAAVNPDLEYVEVAHPEWDHTLICGARTLGPSVRDGRVTEVRRFKGTELVGLTYETMFPELEAQQPVEHRVVPWAEVDEAEGSGIVHLAPGCGLADYELGRELGLAVLTPVDDQAVYGPGYGWLTGRPVAEVAEAVVERLQTAGKLLRSEMYAHSYPHCWRCKGELIFRLVGEWFIRSDEIRPQLIEAARSVEWLPEFIGSRMEDWLRNMGDWCISRKRFWGLSLPFYVCPDCERLTVVGSRRELRELAVDPAVVDALPELHRPWIDEVRIRCPHCAAEVERIPEVGDCWLDAGIVPFTTLGYFDDRAAWEETFPVEWVAEMREQVRLWYYSMLFMSVVITGRAPYEKVLSYERVVAEDGTKFSKSGFMINFDDAVEKMGADMVRYLFCRHPVATECRFGYNLAEIARRRLAIFWNVYSFFTTYAVIDEPENPAVVPAAGLQLADRWLLASTKAFADNVRAAYEAWDTTGVVKEFEQFADDLANWYVRGNRRRFWRQGAVADKQVAYAVLYQALKTAIQALAPIIPFLTEEIWQNLVRSVEPEAPESVHHSLLPNLPENWRDDALLAETVQVRELISEALRLRNQLQVRVRQPLAALYLKVGPELAEAVRRQLDAVMGELNVKRVEFIDGPEALEVDRLELDFAAAGPVLRGDVGRVKGLLEALAPEAAEAALAAVRSGRPVSLPGREGELPANLFKLTRTLQAGFEAGRTRDAELWLDLRVDPALRREGLARDLIRHIQVARREAELDVRQRIALAIDAVEPELRAAVEEHGATIRDEVLALSLTTDLDGAGPAREWLIEGSPVRVAFTPVAG